MKNGFADGAYSRWRSLYELSVICCFINNADEIVAKAFIEAANGHIQYDWAAASGIIKPKRDYVTFSEIQKKVWNSKNMWSKQYYLANQLVHASPQGTFKRIGGYQDSQILVGQTDFGIELPAEHSAISLSIIAVTFFSLFSSSESLLVSQIITGWIDVIRDYYFKVHDNAFPDEESIHTVWVEKYQRSED
jgi:hypothetical protein